MRKCNWQIACTHSSNRKLQNLSSSVGSSKYLVKAPVWYWLDASIESLQRIPVNKTINFSLGAISDHFENHCFRNGVSRCPSRILIVTIYSNVGFGVSGCTIGDIWSNSLIFWSGKLMVVAGDENQTLARNFRRCGKCSRNTQSLGQMLPAS